MKLNSPFWPCLLALDPSIAASLVAAWDCKINVSSASWDLTSLSNEQIVTHTRSSPPSEYVEEVRWNICKELTKREGYDDADQCPAGTLACLTETNKKHNDGGDRITAVIPLAVASDLKPEASSMQPPSKGLSLLLHGSSFPSSDPASVRHSLNLTLLCNSSEESPKFVGFDRQRGVVDIEWSVPAACPTSKDGSHDHDGEQPPEKENPPVPAAGGGLGWFFLMLLLAIIGYFGLGAYYNYNNYGSTGWDLVPVGPIGFIAVTLFRTSTSPPITKMENANPQYTCISCAIAFITADDQRGHYKSDHHRYNMKRRVAGLPPVTAHAFNEKVLERRAETTLTTSATGKTCRICRKVYTTENAYRSHVASKKHRDAEAAHGPSTDNNPTPSRPYNAQSQTLPQPVVKPVTNDPGNHDTSIEAKTSGSRTSVPPTTCLFCALTSESIEANVTHMTRQHGFFIPDKEYLLDLPGLLTYLGKKIAVNNICIWCNGRGRAFHSLDAVRKHMLDKSHCKIAYDSQDDRLDVSDYYDFTSSYTVPSTGTAPARTALLARKKSPANKDDEQWEDDEGVPEDEVDEVVEEEDEDDEDIHDGAQVTYGDTPYELVLPSGARIGHRSLKRYYVQKFSDPLPDVSGFENSDSVVVRRLLKESRTGLIPASGGGFGGSGRGMMTIKANSIHQAKEAGRHIKEHRDARAKEQFRIKAGFKANHQKHYRDQLLQ